MIGKQRSQQFTKFGVLQSLTCSSVVRMVEYFQRVSVVVTLTLTNHLSSKVDLGIDIGRSLVLYDYF